MYHTLLLINTQTAFLFVESRYWGRRFATESSEQRIYISRFISSIRPCQGCSACNWIKDWSNAVMTSIQKYFLLVGRSRSEAANRVCLLVPGCVAFLPLDCTVPAKVASLRRSAPGTWRHCRLRSSCGRYTQRWSTSYVGKCD